MSQILNTQTGASLPFVAFLMATAASVDSPEDAEGTIYAYQKETDKSAAEATDDLIQAVAAGEVQTQVIDQGHRQILTASLSKRAVRRINRARKAERADEIHINLVRALEAERPQKIGDLVDTLGYDRAEVLDVLRAGRDVADGETPTFYSFNPTNSNFHVEWSTDPENTPYPEPEEDEDEGSDNDETAVPADADDAAPADNGSDPDEDSASSEE